MNDFVVAGLGIGTVFVALVCIIVLCELTGALFRFLDGKRKNLLPPASVSEQKTKADETSEEDGWVPAIFENRGTVMAAISAAIAEDCGTDVGHLRILSVRESASHIPDREKLCAIISAAIAEDTGASRVRICSIRRL